MAAPAGNRNAARENRDWTSAIRRVVAQNPEKLREAAMNVLVKAAEGEPWAVAELGNRLDGKPVQQVDMNANINQPMTLTDAYLAHVAAGGKPDDYSETAKTEH